MRHAMKAAVCRRVTDPPASRQFKGCDCFDMLCVPLVRKAGVLIRVNHEALVFESGQTCTHKQHRDVRTSFKPFDQEATHRRRV